MPSQVGFVFNHDLGAGCSPDRLIGRDGMLQIKTSFPGLWVSNVIRDEAPIPSTRPSARANYGSRQRVARPDDLLAAVGILSSNGSSATSHISPSWPRRSQPSTSSWMRWSPPCAPRMTCWDAADGGREMTDNRARSRSRDSRRLAEQVIKSRRSRSASRRSPKPSR